MKKKTTPASLVVCLLSLGWGFVSCRALAENSRDPRIELERFLREAKVIDVKKDVSPGRSRPWIVTLAEGEVRHLAVFKHFDFPRPKPQPHSYRYELAAYALDKLLDARIVPPVVLRKIEGRRGALQIYLENCVSEQDRRRKKLEPPDPRAFANELEGVRVFESLVNDECLNFVDLLVHTEDWRVCRVDFSEAFAPSADLRAECRLTVCSRRLFEGLLKLNEPTVRKVLGSCLNDQEYADLLARKDQIIVKIRALIAEKGEASVLF
jgi:hypothetical protein